MTVTDTQVNTILNSEATLVDRQLQNVKNTITSQNRVMALNDSYSKKMAMYTRLVLAIIFALAIAILLNMLKTRFSIIPDSVVTIAYIILFSGCLIYGMFVLADINSREKTDFDQLDLEPPAAVKKGIRGVKGTRSSGDLDLLPGFCIGKDCCKSGSFFDNETDKCTQCAAGKFTSIDGAEVCAECGKGEYSNISGADSCTKCAAGTYADKLGSIASSDCTACVPGKYSDVAGAPCSDCPMGKYSATSGSTSCTPFGIGKYLDTTGGSSAASCISCPIGKYSNILTGASSCTDCDRGFYSDIPGASSCTQCPAGKYSTGLGSSSCTDCPAGKYSTTLGASSASTCLSCPANTYSLTIGASNVSTCIACPTGTTSPVGSTLATQCTLVVPTST